MNKIKNIFGVLLALAAMSAFYSCDDDVKYRPADKLDSVQVYFPNTNSSSINLSSLENSFEIAIARIKTDEAITVPLIVTGTNGLYNFPTSVSFAQGASTAVITMTYNPSAIEFDDFIELKLSIADETYTTVYGMSEYTFKVGIPAPWTSLGKCTFTEDFMTTFYGVSNTPYEVEIQESQLQPGLFRLVNPFGEAYPFNDPGDWDDSKNWYLEIHAEDPTAVYISVQAVGLDWGRGMLRVGSLAGYHIANGKTLEEVKTAGYTGTYNKGVITFPAGTHLISMPQMGTGGLYTANNNGAFKVVFPGAVLTDYSIEIDYAGTHTDADNEVAGVLAQIDAIGADVENIRLAIVEGTDADAALDGIKNGDIDYLEAPAATGTVLVPFATKPPVGGDYMIVAVTYANNMAQEGEVVSFTYTPAP